MQALSVRTAHFAFIISVVISNQVNSGHESQASIAKVGSKQQRFKEVPSNKTALIGDSVTLACILENKQGRLLWFKDCFALYNLDAFPTYHLFGNRDKGDYSLTIDSVALEDEGSFHCHVEPDQFGVELQSPDAYLTVVVKPNLPEILQGSSIEVITGSVVTLICRCTYFWKPTPKLVWRHSNGRAVAGKIISQNDVGIFASDPSLASRFSYFSKVIRSILMLRVTKEDNQENIYCHVMWTKGRIDYELIVGKMFAIIQFNVKFPPKVEVMMGPVPQAPLRSVSGSRWSWSSRFFQEFDDVQLICKSDGNPSIFFRWFVNDQPIDVIMRQLGQLWDTTLSDSGEIFTLVLYNATRKLNGCWFKCEGENSIGKSANIFKIDLKFGPVFKLKLPETTDASFGFNITLTCEADGNPEPEIVWFHAREFRSPSKAISTGSTVSIAIEKDTVGFYECFAVVPGFPNISSKTWIPPFWEEPTNKLNSNSSLNLFVGLIVVLSTLLVSTTVLVILVVRRRHRAIIIRQRFRSTGQLMEDKNIYEIIEDEDFVNDDLPYPSDETIWKKTTWKYRPTSTAL